MRHQHFCLSGILIALAVAGAGACRSEIEAVSSPDMPSGPVGRELSVQASVENHVVKAEMGAEGLQTQFSEGDRISLFLEMTDGQVQEIPFSATGTTPSMNRLTCIVKTAWFPVSGRSRGPRTP